MSDPIDDLVAESADTQTVANRLAEGFHSIYSKFMAILGRPGASKIRSVPSEEVSEGSPSSTRPADSTASGFESSTNPVTRGTHIEHPYCFSEPRNPFVEDMSKEWSSPNEQRAPHYLERSLR